MSTSSSMRLPKSSFVPINIANASFLRRIAMTMAPAVASLSRKAWHQSRVSRSTFYSQAALWQGLWLLNRQVGCLPRQQSVTTFASVGSGIRMKLDLARLTDAFAFSFGVGESDVGYIAQIFCSKDAVILDVGANIGSACL